MTDSGEKQLQTQEKQIMIDSRETRETNNDKLKGDKQ